MNRRPDNDKLRRYLVRCVALSAFIIVSLSSQQVHAAVLSPGDINTCGELAAPGRYSLTANVSTSTGACFTVTSDSVVLTSSTTGSYTVNGSIIGDATASSSPGFNFSIEDLTVTGTTSSNGGSFGTTSDFTDTGSAGNAGSIAVSTSTMGAIVANGGVDYNDNYGNYSGAGGTITVDDSTFSSISANGGGYVNTSVSSGMIGGNGGTVVIIGGTLDISNKTILAAGGTGGNLGTNGNNGSLTLDYTSLNHANLALSSISALTLNGPGNSPGNLGSFGAGILGALPGDTITTASQCNLGLAGTYSLGGNIYGNCVITNDSVVLNGAGNTISGNVIGDGGDSVARYDYPGHDFTVENLTVTGTTSANGTIAPQTGNGGSITMIDATSTGISADGGPATFLSGGNGGSVTVMASSTDLSGVNLSLSGGSPGPYGATGTPGTLTVDYATVNYSGLYLPPLSGLIFNGPGNSPGNLGSWNGGVVYAIPGSIITSASQCILDFAGTYTLGSNISGNCSIATSSVILDGAGHTITGNVNGNNATGTGYGFTVENAVVTDTISSNATGTSTAATGGSVTASSTSFSSIQANSTAGSGGSITVIGGAIVLSGESISATGGGTSTPGTLTLDYSTLSYSNLTLSALSALSLNGPDNSPGNLGAFAGGTISAISPGGTITSLSQCFLISAGTYTLGNNITGNCSIKANNVVLNGAGFTINGNITGTGSTTGLTYSLQNLIVIGTTSADGAAGDANGGNAGSITLATSTVGSVTANGGTGTSGYGGYGGSISITNSTETSVQSNGGSSGFSNGNGGSIIITKTDLDLTNTIILASRGSGAGFPGTRGTLTLDYSMLDFASTTTLPVLSDLVLNGPGNLPGDMGAWSGGVLGTPPGGTIASAANCNFIEAGTYYFGGDLTGNCTIQINGVTIDGQGHTLNGNIVGDGVNAGHIFALQNITVTGTTSANATNMFNSGVTGGSITVSTSTLATTTVNSTGGNAGSISVTDSTVSDIQVNGGTRDARSGNGGSVTITAGTLNLASTTISASDYGGSPGTLALNYTTLNASGAILPALSDLVLNGPGGLPGDLGAWPGGPLVLPGGTITTASQCNLQTAGTYTLGSDLTGNCYIKADGVTLDGSGHTINGNVIGDGTSTAHRGYNFTLENAIVTGTTSSNGNGSIGGYGMPGGAITLINATSTGVTANGGALGGSITVTNSAINLASTTFSATGSVKNGTLTLNYTALNTSGSSLPALSDLVLNGPGDLPGDVGDFGGGSFTLGGGTISSASQCSNITASGLYTLSSNISGANCQITADGVVIDGAGNTLNGNVTGRDFVLRDLNMIGQAGLENNGRVTVSVSSIDLANITFAASSTATLTLDYTTLANYSSASLPALSDLILNGPGNSPGDVGAFGGGSITAPGGTITSASQCFLVFPGTYTIGNGFTGNCGVHSDNIILTGATSTVIRGNVIGNGVFPGGSGYDFTLQNITASGTVSSNGAVNTNGIGGNGGSITLDNASGTIDLATTTVSATGGVGSSGNGTAGKLTLDYSTLNYYGVSLPAFSDLVLNGPGNIPGDLGAFAGGYIAVLPGGTITSPSQLTYLNLPGTYTLGNDITGNATIIGSGIVINGAGHTLNGSVIGDGSDYIGPADWGFFGSGSNFTLENITVTGTTSANGGNYFTDIDYQPGQAGSITISSSTVATTTANGGYANRYHDATNGGTIIINNSTTTFVQADGGAGSYYGGSYRDGAGGNGGTITIDPSVTGPVEANGGDSPVKPAGNGGTISITDSFANPGGSTVKANGGDSTVCGYGGGGGAVHMVNSTYGTVTADPGSDSLSSGCTQYNNQSISSSGSSYGGMSLGSSGLSGLVQVVGQYAPALSVVSPTVSQSPALSPVAAPVTAEGASFESGGSTTGVPGVVPIAAPASPGESSGSSPGVIHSIVSFFQSSATGAATVVAQTATVVANSPTTKTVQVTGFFAGLVASVISAADTAYAAPLAAEALLTPLRLWGLALMGLGIRKRGRPWGTVYDSVTKRPIDPAYVTVKDTEGRIVAESITDLDGRYGFLLPDGTYYLSVRKTHYEFPSKKMEGKSFDELYNSLYFGGPVTVSSGEVLDKNIPMDQKDFDWNEEVKKKLNAFSFHSRNEKRWSLVTDCVYGLGFLVSVTAVAVHRSSYNITMMVLYTAVVAFLYWSSKNKKLGHVVDGNTHMPLSYAIVRVTAYDHETVLRSAVCDARGRYYCIVPKGQYYVDIEKKNPDGSYSRAYGSGLVSSNSGFLNENFAV